MDFLTLSLRLEHTLLLSLLFWEATGVPDRQEQPCVPLPGTTNHGGSPSHTH